VKEDHAKLLGGYMRALADDGMRRAAQGEPGFFLLDGKAPI
jgi:hypothetical protein